MPPLPVTPLVGADVIFAIMTYYAFHTFNYSMIGDEYRDFTKLCHTRVKQNMFNTIMFLFLSRVQYLTFMHYTE